MAAKYDFEGKCTNKAFKEVYPSLMGKKFENLGWSYLCRRHFKEEQTKFRNKLPYCDVDECDK